METSIFFPKVTWVLMMQPGFSPRIEEQTKEYYFSSSMLNIEYIWKYIKIKYLNLIVN